MAHRSESSGTTNIFTNYLDAISQTQPRLQSTHSISNCASDVRTLVVNPQASAADVYPISGLTFLLIPKQPKDAAKGQALTNLVKYILSTGQDSAEQLHDSKLPSSLQQVDQQLVSHVSGRSGGGGAGGQ